MIARLVASDAVFQLRDYLRWRNANARPSTPALDAANPSGFAANANNAEADRMQPDPANL